MRLIKQKPLTSWVNSLIIDLAVPANINYAWGLGSTLALFLSLQVVTGLFLAQHYISSVALAFSSVDNIMRELNLGWALRYTHANGASFFIVLAYFHILKGIYYGSFNKPRSGLWISGVSLFLLIMLTAFVGYCLPWGSMSMWGAVVITNLLTVIPIFGEDLVQIIWGGFAVSAPTLTRFYSFHYLIPFIIIGLAIIHIILLHETGSSNPIGVSSKHNKIRFFPYFILKDLVGWLIIGLLFIVFVFFFPDFLGHSDNFNEADALVTPATIEPEFYFLAFFAILRSIPNKAAGVLAMLSSILVLYLLPIMCRNKITSSKFKSMSTTVFYWFIALFILLTFLGQRPAEMPYTSMAQISSIGYFIYFIIVLPFLNKWEGRK